MNETTIEKFGERIGGVEQDNAVINTRLSIAEKTLEKMCEKLDGITLKVSLFTGMIVAFVTYLPKISELFK